MILLRCENLGSLMEAWGFCYAGRYIMPRKPKHVCHYPGCNQLTESRFCEMHTREENRRYEKYNRDPATRERYGKLWRKIRYQYIQLHPLCEQCLREGRLTPVEEVHHILPLSDGGTNDFDNLVSLCKSCHSRLHAKEGRRWGRKRITD